ncbi:restriction endonuclease [Campylobacter ureolyticus]|uniref:restriction endonuclease n=1 Tax=Campylobacter ureolyticus TaxID=827 RepID=UPI0022B412C0|nr:restriction endonuclease [Campylobacter ureolyticus]MCZ6172902.1 restriction endonuclease [Campylobacter ureolyticus]
MTYFIIFVVTIILVILINKTRSDNKNLDEKIKDYEQNQKERKEFREWFNSQNFKAKNNNLKPKKKFYYGENWKKKKGDDYEFYIKKFYENEGYKVFPNGYIKGFKDGGIDLVAHKGKETILIQCKNWKSKAELKSITKFYNDCKNYEKYNYKKLNSRYIRKVFVISNEIQNSEIDDFLKKINNEIEFLNVPIF